LPEMRCLLAHLPDAKRLGNAPLRFSILPSAVCLVRVLSRHSLSRSDGKFVLQNLARRMLFQITMSSFEPTEEKTAPAPQSGGKENGPGSQKPEADRHISFTLAHELNNALTVVQGNADHLFSRHRENVALAPTLKKISEAAHRAAELVRTAPKLDFDPPTA
jgi:signal transduction histidine kinase